MKRTLIAKGIETGFWKPGMCTTNALNGFFFQAQIRNQSSFLNYPLTINEAAHQNYYYSRPGGHSS